MVSTTLKTAELMPSPAASDAMATALAARLLLRFRNATRKDGSILAGGWCNRGATDFRPELRDLGSELSGFGKPGDPAWDEIP